MKKTDKYLKVVLSAVLLFGAMNSFGQTEAKGAIPTTASGKINGHEYVDLGLSVKWATCNVGASSPIDYGDYYLWGEICTRPTTSEKNISTSAKRIGDIAGDTRYDAARVDWGETWRLPTKDEMQELIDNCTTEWTTLNGVKGMLVTSKKNGNSIFLPGAGRTLELSLFDVGDHGLYWSSTPYEWHLYGAYFLDVDSQTFIMFWGYRSYGQSIRPVSE